ncbi:hypothetical protein PLESTM_001323900 [Pleodorina starrii]|nr:hypothetical protein PLESTM_001323900 [Pleodorina starrii]
MAQPPIQLGALKAHVHIHPKKRIVSSAGQFVGGATGRPCLAVVRNSRTSSGTLPTWMTVKPADSRQSPFHELELMDLWDGTGKTRVRQHVNPLRREFQTPTSAPDWGAVFTDLSLPLALDIGSGYGRFLLLLQRNNPQQQVNYLGLEIRRTLVDRANQWVNRLGLQGRVHYVFTNATVSLSALLGSYPGPITDVFIQFPDPHFKRRHHKRRVVQPQLVAALRDLMPPGGRLLLQSDVEETCVAMRNMFERYGADAFVLAPQHSTCPVFYSRPMGQPAAAPEGAATSSMATGSFEAVEGVHDEPATASQPAVQGTAVSAARHAGPTQPVIDYAAAAAGAARHAMTAATAAAAAVRQAEDAARADASTDIDDGDAPELSGGGGGAAADGGRRRGLVQAEAAADGAASASASDGDATTSDDDGDADDSDADADIDSMVSEWAKGGWLVDNPIGTPTEREHYVGQQGLPVYRVLLVRA